MNTSFTSVRSLEFSQAQVWLASDNFGSMNILKLICSFRSGSFQSKTSGKLGTHIDINLSLKTNVVIKFYGSDVDYAVV